MEKARRQILKMVAATPFAMAMSPVFSSEMSMKDRVTKIIREYSSQGIHRTGTAVDLASAEWFRNQITELGVAPEEDRFSFKRIDVQKSELEINGTVIHGIPLYDCLYTNAEGVRGQVGEIGSDADIGVVSSLPHLRTPGGQSLAKARVEAKHKAIIVVTDSRLPPGITTFNAENYTEPFGPPVLQIAHADWLKVEGVLTAEATATLTAQCRYVDARGINIGATIKGKNSKLAPLVIMTPRSGWWACASERGGGIACLLEMMRAIQQSGPQRDVIFTANTGHELSHIGLDHYLDRRRQLVRAAHMWIHLGANFAAKIAPGIRLQYSDEAAQSLLTDALTRRDLKPSVETPLSTRPYGEARNIHDGQGRYISLLGGNGLFHHPDDVWPNAVDLDLTVKWIEAFTDLGLQLSS